MAYCQYEETGRVTGEPSCLLFEIKCPWCDTNLWVRRGEFPRDWCGVRPENRPYMQCKHLGNSHRKAPNKLCGSCKGETTPIFICSVHGECSDRQLQHNQKMMHCLKCFTDGLGFEAKENDNATHPSGTRLPAASPRVD